MKFMIKGLTNALHLHRSVPVVHLSQSSKNIPGQKRKYTGKNTSGISAGAAISIGVGALPIVGFLGYQFYQLYYNVQEDAIHKKVQLVSNVTEKEVGAFKAGLPSYSTGQISQHKSMDSRIWVTYKEGVYDITDYVRLHPGGQQILKAAGGSIEPFWQIYAVHQAEPVYEILEEYRIGNLQPKHMSGQADSKDYFGKEPTRNSQLVTLRKTPFCADTEGAILVDSFCTPNDLFFVRNHLYVPDINADTYTFDLEVEGDSKKYTFTLDDIKGMPQHTITGALMCAGNRRIDMQKVQGKKPMTAVLDTTNGAVGCATWTGVRVCDLLKIAGVDGENEKHKHVHFEGYDHDGTGVNFSSSIPIWKAVDKRCDLILAYEMNGEPLLRDHGYPLRLFIPGHSGVRHIKWIARILVSEQECTGHWYQHEYKGFAPEADWDNVDWDSAPPAQEYPVTSAICRPVDGEEAEVIDGHVTFQGYAYSGSGNRIIRVDVTPDGGKTWLVANLDQLDEKPPQHWAWTHWHIDIPVAKGLREMEVWAKAVDSCYNSQPETCENIYNFRGVMINAYPRVKVKLVRCNKP